MILSVFLKIFLIMVVFLEWLDLLFGIIKQGNSMMIIILRLKELERSLKNLSDVQLKLIET